MRLVWCDNGLVGQAGHHANLAAGAIAETRRLRVGLAIWGNVRIEPALAGELRAIPVFRSSPYDVAPSGALAQTTSWLRCSRRITQDLTRAAPEPNDVLLFPTTRAAEVMGVARWLSSAARPPTAVCMNFMLDDFRPSRRLLSSAWPLLYRLSLRRAAAQASCPVLLTAGSSGLTEALRALGADARAYPMPKAYPPPSLSSGIGDTPSLEPAKIAYVGVPWSMKGGELLADVLAQCEAAELACRIIAQRPGRAHSTVALDEPLAALARSPLVELVQGPLDRDAYYQMLAGCDLVFLPYDPPRYRRMNSGVFAEALALGKPVVVPAGTSMSEMLSQGHGAGVVFERFEPASIVGALRRALEARVELAVKAQRSAPAWRQAQSLGAYIDRLLADLASEGVQPFPASGARGIALDITLDRQLVSQHCTACNEDFTVLRGSVYEGGEGIGLYLIALHGHSPEGRIAHLAVALLAEPHGEPVAAAMDVTCTPREFGFSLVEWNASPWRTETYLGTMLEPDQVRAGPERSMFFHVAKHVADDLSEVRAYFA